MGSATYPKVLLVEMARSPRATATVAATRHYRAPRLSGRLQQPRSLAVSKDGCATNRAEQNGVTAIRLSVSQRSCGYLARRWFNRRMRKTARPVVWEGAEAQSPALDLIPRPRLALYKNKKASPFPGRPFSLLLRTSLVVHPAARAVARVRSVVRLLLRDLADHRFSGQHQRADR
jgi:hypothetical protein